MQNHGCTQIKGTLANTYLLEYSTHIYQFVAAAIYGLYCLLELIRTSGCVGSSFVIQQTVAKFGLCCPIDPCAADY